MTTLTPEIFLKLGGVPNLTSQSISMIRVVDLRKNSRNARTHSKKQIQLIASSIVQFGFNNPILIDSTNTIVAGHGRLEAAKLLGLETVPTLSLEHLSSAEKRAYMLADNKIAEQAGWDLEVLAIELQELSVEFADLQVDLEITGFETGEIDQIFSDHEENSLAKSADHLPEQQTQLVSRRGDRWRLGKHWLHCGDARNKDAMASLLNGEAAGMVITDPPYNVKVNGHVGGRGSVTHEEFAMASGEMSTDQFRDFLRDSFLPMIISMRPGALIYCYIDWRHMLDLLGVGQELGLSLINICVWQKSSPGQGSFYRSGHEMIAVFAKPGAKSTNNILLGKFGRNRSNVWSFPSVNTFKTGKDDDLALHPTVKPVAMIAEAIKDASKRGEIVLDPFLGSGTTLLAAEKVGRRCYGIEYEPKYIDTAIRRWQVMTGKDAILVSRSDPPNIPVDTPSLDEAHNLTFDELMARSASNEGGDDER